MAKAANEGPDMVSLTEAARRVVTEGIEDSMSHQRVSQLSLDDPDFPPVVMIGRSKAVDWKLARLYFIERVKRQGRRSDLGQ